MLEAMQEECHATSARDASTPVDISDVKKHEAIFLEMPQKAHTFMTVFIVSADAMNEQGCTDSVTM